MAFLPPSPLLRFSACDVRAVLVLAALSLLLIGLWVWVLVRGFRRTPPGVLRLTFLDARGVPNGVLLTVFLAVVMMALCTLVGLVSGRWAPGYVWGGWFGIAAWGIGADALVTGLTPAAYTQQAYNALGGAGYGEPAAPYRDADPATPTSPPYPVPDAVN